MLKPFKLPYEDVYLTGKNIKMSLLSDPTMDIPFTRIHEKMVVTENADNKIISGYASMALRNESNGSNSVLLLSGDFNIKAKLSMKSHEAFYKLAEYLYYYAKGYSTEKDLIDKKGIKFKMPPWPYSSGSFKSGFS
jgi:hypothetical protein